MTTSDIVLATINAKYIHASFGLRYLVANLGELRSKAQIIEFTANTSSVDMAQAILEKEPKIIGLGVYVWNAEETTELVTILRRLRPDIPVVIGGPEVSYEIDDQEICRQANYIITGEGEVTFRRLCEQLLAGKRPLNKIVPTQVPNIEDLVLPYDLYNDDDVAHRVIYVESSRGCPFRCEFCLSSLDQKVRTFELEQFLLEMQKLYERGVRHFKFVDRTFNIDVNRAKSILDFFYARLTSDLFLHFEMIPDRLPDELREPLSRFPAGTIQLEIGIQTFDDEVCKRISRRQSLPRLEDNFKFLHNDTGAHMHADLIVGLPGEGVKSFALGLDRLSAMGPHEIQVGILKRLRGAPIIRHTEEFGMVYSPYPPYEILQNNDIDFPTMQRLKRFAHGWNMYVNSGNFNDSIRHVWQDTREDQSTFFSTLDFCDWLYKQEGKMHAMSLVRRADYLLRFLVDIHGHDEGIVEAKILNDFKRAGRGHPGKIRRKTKEQRAAQRSNEGGSEKAATHNSRQSRFVSAPA